ncbi:MAG: phage holin family protein [Gemmatimonas sp.]|nr:phage holin family protein [Gemmatimonas sp.]
MAFILRWIASAAGVWAAVQLVPGIRIEDGLVPLFAVALILGAINAIVRPILTFLACGLIFLTLGLFLFVINAGLLLLVSEVSQFFGINFAVAGFEPAFFGSIIITLVAWLASVLLPEPKKDR